jgi:hypothetical protein
MSQAMLERGRSCASEVHHWFSGALRDAAPGDPFVAASRASRRKWGTGVLLLMLSSRQGSGNLKRVVFLRPRCHRHRFASLR